MSPGALLATEVTFSCGALRDAIQAETDELIEQVVHGGYLQSTGKGARCQMGPRSQEPGSRDKEHRESGRPEGPPPAAAHTLFAMWLCAFVLNAPPQLSP